MKARDNFLEPKITLQSLWIRQGYSIIAYSMESLTAAKKIKDLAAGINKKVSTVLNKIESEETAQWLKGELRKVNMAVIGTIPNDPVIFNVCLKGRTLNQSEAYNSTGRVLDSILLNR